VDKNLKQQVLSLARVVRSWAESRDDAQKHPSGDLNGWCAIASGKLSRELAKNEIAHEIHVQSSDYGCHVYVVVDDHVVDVTATQFPDFRNTPVLIMHCREAECYSYYNAAATFTNVEQLIKYQRKQNWSVNQIAYSK